MRMEARARGFRRFPGRDRHPIRKREIIQGADDAKTYGRPLPANARATLIEAHRWLHDYRRKLRKCRTNPVD
jgi:hypothetical protein